MLTVLKCLGRSEITRPYPSHKGQNLRQRLATIPPSVAVPLQLCRYKLVNRRLQFGQLSFPFLLDPFADLIGLFAIYFHQKSQ